MLTRFNNYIETSLSNNVVSLRVLFCGLKAEDFDMILLCYEGAKANISEIDSFLDEEKEIKNFYSYSVFEKQYNLKKLPFTHAASYFENEEKRKLIKVMKKPEKKEFKPMMKKTKLEDQPRLGREHVGIQEIYDGIHDLIKANCDLALEYCRNPNQECTNLFSTNPIQMEKFGQSNG